MCTYVYYIYCHRVYMYVRYSSEVTCTLAKPLFGQGCIYMYQGLATDYKFDDDTIHTHVLHAKDIAHIYIACS